MIASRPENQRRHLLSGYSIFKPYLYRTVGQYGDIIAYLYRHPNTVKKIREKIESRKERYLEKVLGIQNEQ